MKGSGSPADDGLMTACEAVVDVAANAALKGLHSKPGGDVYASQSPRSTSASETVRTQEAQVTSGKTMNGGGRTCDVSGAVPAGVLLSAPHIHPPGHLGVAGVPVSQTPAVHRGPAHRRDGFTQDEQVSVRSEQAPAAISELSPAGTASTFLDARDGSTPLPESKYAHGMEASALTEESVKPTPADMAPSPKLDCGGGDLADKAVPDESRKTERADVDPGERSCGEAATPASTGVVAQTPPAAENNGIAAGSDAQGAVAPQSLPDDSVWGSTIPASVESPATEYLLAPSSAGRRRSLEEASTEPPPWGEPIEPESPGDTADIAIAAVSYANAVAARGALDTPNGRTTMGSTLPAPNHACEKPSIAAAVLKNGRANDVASESMREGEADSMGPAAAAVAAVAAAAHVSAQTSPPRALNSEAAPHVAEVSSVGGATPGTTRSSSRGKTGLRGDHHDDMMHAMCMICLEKLSDATEGGGAKMLGLLDKCSHRYCYTVSKSGMEFCSDRMPCGRNPSQSFEWKEGGGFFVKSC